MAISLISTSVILLPYVRSGHLLVAGSATSAPLHALLCFTLILRTKDSAFVLIAKEFGPSFINGEQHCSPTPKRPTLKNHHHHVTWIAADSVGLGLQRQQQPRRVVDSKPNTEPRKGYKNALNQQVRWTVKKRK